MPLNTKISVSPVTPNLNCPFANNFGLASVVAPAMISLEIFALTLYVNSAAGSTKYTDLPSVVFNVLQEYEDVFPDELLLLFPEL